MAQMSMPGSAVNATSIGRAAIPKPLAGSPAEIFMAFIDAAPGGTIVNRAPGAAQAIPTKPSAVTTSNHTLPRNGIKGARQIVELSPHTAIPTPETLQSKTNPAPITTIISPALGTADKSCENAKPEIVDNAAKTTPLIDPSPARLAPIASTGLIAQVANPIADKASSRPVNNMPVIGRSGGPDAPPATTPANAPAPLGIQIPPSTAGNTPSTDGSSVENPGARGVAIAEIVPVKDPAPTGIQMPISMVATAPSTGGSSLRKPGAREPAATGTDTAPVNAPAPIGTQLTPNMVVATAPSPDGSPSEKPIAHEAAITDIAPTNDPASQLIGTTPNPDTKPPGPVETAPTPPSTAFASAGTAIAEANRAVALRVSRAIRSGQDTLTIELHPTELGHVAVRLAFHGNSVDVRMVVSREETFQAFTQDRAALEQQFSQAGIDLGAGGLDLRHGQTPAPESWQGSPSRPPQDDSEPNHRESRAVILGDNLVNIVA